MPRKHGHKTVWGEVPPLAGTPTTPPMSYTVDTSWTIYTLPTLPSLGAAGFQFTDPTFGSPMLRLTDANTRPDHVNWSFTGPSSSETNIWNTDTTKFYATINETGAQVIPYHWNAATMTATRMGNLGSAEGGLIITTDGAPCFSFLSADKLYLMSGRIIKYYSFAGDTYTTIVDLDTLIPGLAGTAGEVSVSGADRLCVPCDGAGQDLWEQVVTYDAGTSTAHKLDTMAGTIDGSPNTDITWGWTIHNARIDKSGRYVLITKGDQSAVVVWDVTAATAAIYTPAGGGHKVTGYGVGINNDAQSGHTYDQKQYLSRSLGALGTVTDLVDPLRTNPGLGSDSHLSWNQAQSDRSVPVLVSSYGGDQTRQLDNEIFAVKTDLTGSRTIWRFCHHRSNAQDFWDTPRGNVSQDGRWFLFSSDWNDSLGAGRNDAFIVKLSAP